MAGMVAGSQIHSDSFGADQLCLPAQSPHLQRLSPEYRGGGAGQDV
jgi:hypothetical protein